MVIRAYCSFLVLPSLPSLQNYHSLALSGVPVFSAANIPQAYRFVTLIDVLYEHRCAFAACVTCVLVKLLQNAALGLDGCWLCVCAAVVLCAGMREKEGVVLRLLLVKNDPVVGVP